MAEVRYEESEVDDALEAGGWGRSLVLSGKRARGRLLRTRRSFLTKFT